MNSTLIRRSALALAACTLLVGGSLASAQGPQRGPQGDQMRPFRQGSHALQSRQLPGTFGIRGVPLGRLALDTTVEVAFYDGDPAAEGAVLDTLTFTYGEDSEVAFAEAFAEARQNADFIAINVGEQTRTLDLTEVTVPTNGRGARLGRLVTTRLQEDGTVTATFYDGDPAQGGLVTDTLSFTYGEDSAAGFANDVTDAAADAAFVTITTSPQSYLVDLSHNRPLRGFVPNFR